MVRVCVVDSHNIIRYGIRSLLETRPGYLIVGEASNLKELSGQIKETPVDVIVTEISPGNTNLDIIKEIRRTSNLHVKIIAIAAHKEHMFIRECFKAGIHGYLLKEFEKFELFSAMERAIKNEIFTCRSVSQLLANNYLSEKYGKEKNSYGLCNLTLREKQVIHSISLGLTNKEIAEKLFVSASTVDVHRYNIMKKLEARNTAEMIMKAIKLNIISVIC